MLTIGEFSKLCHVSARMLRHYDLIGLLRPAHIGENGYRYYNEDQLSRLLHIEELKGYGFSLAEVQELLGLSREELSQRIHRQRLKAYGQLHQLRGTLRRMEEDLTKLEGTQMSLSQYPVIVMQCHAQRVFAIRRTINVSQTHELFQELLQEAARRGLTRTGVTQQVYLGEEFNYDQMEVEAQVEVAGEDPAVKELPARLCVAVTHAGPYETLKNAYDAVCAWIARHPEYRVCGPSIERYLKDEQMVRDPEELETGVLFPVERIRNN